MIEAAESAPALADFFARQLGADRARLAETLRKRLWDAGVTWPRWIDARPGRLGAIVGDCSDPPLGRTQEHLLSAQRPLLIEGLAALGLALSAPRLGIFTTSAALKQSLATELAKTAIEIYRAPAFFPAQPARAVRKLAGAPWVVSAQTLVAAGAALRGTSVPRLCSVVGALRAPQVLQIAPDETPRQIVRRAGGALAVAWVALVDDALHGTLWSADAPLRAATSILYILPTNHSLIRRHKSGLRERTRATCLSCRLCSDFCVEAPQGTAPHLVMQSLARGALDGDVASAASGCTSCGACSAICPAELLPSGLISALATAQPAKRDLDEPPPASAPSRLPMELVLRRLDLLRYAP